MLRIRTVSQQCFFHCFSIIHLALKTSVELKCDAEGFLAFPRGFQCRIVNIGAISGKHCVYLMSLSGEDC